MNQKSRKVRIVAPYEFTHRFSVKAIDSGLTLLELFSLRFPFKTETDWKNRIETGQILLNDTVVTSKTEIKTGDRISHFTPKVIEPSVPDEVSILEETGDWIAVFKPAPMPMHSGGRYHKNTLQAIIEEQLGKPVFVTHRLDAVTSGIILLAKNENMAKEIAAAFAEKLVGKEYTALVKGFPTQENWTVKKSIRRKEGFVFECCDEMDGGKSAETRFLCEIKDESTQTSRIKCFPQTGRTHQIRLHLAESGHPIVDDLIYNGSFEGKENGLQNFAIHLCHTSLVIPSLGIQLNCELPEFWENT